MDLQRRALEIGNRNGAECLISQRAERQSAGADVMVYHNFNVAGCTALSSNIVPPAKQKRGDEALFVRMTTLS